MRPPPADSAETIRRLVAECLERIEEGGPSAAEELLRLHPEHAERVRSRLQSLEEAGLLETPAGAEPRLPERLGPFRLIERIGGGGMGVVYLAEQEALGRQVALKLVRPDLLFFEGARERFRREVEAAGRLKHPGIVPVYTVGEEEGVPYFAMEFVEGCSLDEVLRALRDRRPDRLRGRDLLRAVEGGAEGAAASEAARSLAESSWTDACLRVVQQVASALDHAHRRGVLHRDVKPSNVMLTPDGRALLLDFGLASTRGTTRLTRTGSQVGSLPYMAPEQLRGEEVDERTDLYGLGVAFYELLALRLPYFAPDPEETRQRILAGAFPPIGTANPAVPWDVETVCATAMDPDPRRRYPAAPALLEDVHAALERRPIAARRPGPLLRARRFVQRNPTWSIGATLGVLIVVGSIAFGLRQRATTRALQAANAAKDAALVETREALQVASEAERRALEELEAKESILAFLNEDLLRSASPKHMGHEVTLREAFDAAVLAIEGRFPERPLVEAAVRTTLGNTYLDLGSAEEAERELRRAHELLLAAGAGDSALGLENLAARADLAFDLGRPEESRRLYEQALEGRRTVLGADHPSTLVTLSNLGGMLAVSGRPEEGEPLLAEAVPAFLRVLGEDDPRTLSAMINHGIALRHTGRIEEGLAQDERAVELCRRHLGEEHTFTLTALHNRAITLGEAGRFEEALPALLRVVEAKERTLGPDHLETLSTLDTLASTYLRVGRPEEARRTLEEAFERIEASGIDPGNARLGYLYHRWGELLRKQGWLEEAEDAFARAFDSLSRRVGPRHPDTLRALEHLARLLMLRGAHDEAERLLSQAIEGDQKGGVALLSRQLWRVDCLRELDRFEEAEEELERAFATLPEASGVAPGAVLDCVEALYAAWGHPEAADEWRDRLPGDDP